MLILQARGSLRLAESSGERSCDKLRLSRFELADKERQKETTRNH